MMAQVKEISDIPACTASFFRSSENMKTYYWALIT